MKPQHIHRRPNATACVGGLAIATLLLTGCGSGQDSGHGPMPPPPVTVAEVQIEDIQIHHTYPGRVRGVREMEIRARVGGLLEQRRYGEGQAVEADDVLFQIETAPYELALQRAEAEWALASATAGQADREWQRVNALFEQSAVSERERDQALAAVEVSTARLQGAEALRAEARLNLDYTTVTAPLPGVAGMENWSEGSLIERGALLTTLIQHDPVQVMFSLPAAEAGMQATGPDQGPSAAVHLWLDDGRLYDSPGELDFADRRINARTGSVQYRALFDNPEGLLVPGQFVRIQVSLQAYEQTVVIPATAMGQGPTGQRVFVLQPDNTVQARAVRAGPVVDGGQVILEGLEVGDLLIVNGQVALQSGMTVAPQNRN